jgi:hypothetical protein
MVTRLKRSSINTCVSKAVIPAGIPESSAMDVSLSAAQRRLKEEKCQFIDSHPCDWIPASLPE